MDKILIAHRGNMDGPNPDKENHPNYIMAAVEAGFDVEVDVWNIDGDFYLGHDNPQYKTNLDFLSNPHFWIHCKDIKSLHYLIRCAHCWDFKDCFFHNTDDVTLTLRTWLWTYPGKEITSGSIAVMPELVFDWDYSKAAGICTDFVNIMKLKL